MVFGCFFFFLRILVVLLNVFGRFMNVCARFPKVFFESFCGVYVCFFNEVFGCL